MASGGKLSKNERFFYPRLSRQQAGGGTATVRSEWAKLAGRYSNRPHHRGTSRGCQSTMCLTFYIYIIEHNHIRAHTHTLGTLFKSTKRSRVSICLNGAGADLQIYHRWLLICLQNERIEGRRKRRERGIAVSFFLSVIRQETSVEAVKE